MLSRLAVSCWVLGLAVLVTSCHAPRKRAWTKEQERTVAAALLETVPEVGETLGIRFDDKLELVGVTLDRTAVRPGDALTVTWVWRSLAEAPGGWKAFVHGEGEGRRETYDHDLVGGLLPIAKLHPGQIIKDVQVLNIPGNFPEGEARLWTGVFDAAAWTERKEDVRMAASGPDAGRIDGDGRVLAARFQVSRSAPAGVPPAEGAPVPAERRLVAYRAPGPIVVDGKLDDAGWQGVPSLSPFVVPQGGGALSATRRPEVKVAYDDAYLYVSFVNPDRDIRSPFSGRDSTLWKADVVEIYLDPGADGRDYLELQVAPTGEIFDAKFSQRREPAWEVAAPGFTIDMKVGVNVQGTLNADGDDEAWTVEVAIPFAEIPGADVPPKPGTSWAVNFYRLDQQFHAAWAPVGNDYHNLPAFGRLEFGAGPPPGAAIPLAPEGAGHAAPAEEGGEPKGVPNAANQEGNSNKIEPNNGAHGAPTGGAAEPALAPSGVPGEGSPGAAPQRGEAGQAP